MEGIHESQEEEDSGDDPYVPPIDSDREDTLFGDFFYPTPPFTDKENLDEAVPMTYEVSRAEGTKDQRKAF